VLLKDDFKHIQVATQQVLDLRHGTPLISIKLISVDNYRDWACAIKLAIQTKNKIGLDDIYQPIRSRLLTKEILPEVKDAFAIVVRKESHRGISPTSTKSDKPQGCVFVSRTNANKRNNDNSNRNIGSMSNGSESDDIYTLNFFDHFESKPTTKIPLRPNDDEEGPPSRDGRVHQPDDGAPIDHIGHDEEHSTTPIGEQNHSEGNVGSNLEVPVFQNDLPNSCLEIGLRRSSTLLAKLNEFMLDDKVKYGPSRYANHFVINSEI
nr:ribonuclease H-like domain-containing protein [Tanacetum cinerariifolium]